MSDIEKEKLNELKRINRNLEALTKAVSKLSATPTSRTVPIQLDTPEYDTPK